MEEDYSSVDRRLISKAVVLIKEEPQVSDTSVNNWIVLVFVRLLAVVAVKEVYYKQHIIKRCLIAFRLLSCLLEGEKEVLKRH